MTICCLLVHVTGFKSVIVIVSVIVGVIGAVVIGVVVGVCVCGGGGGGSGGGRVAGAPHEHTVPNPNTDGMDETIPRAVPRAVQERGTLNSTFFTLYPRLFVDRTGVPRRCV